MKEPAGWLSLIPIMIMMIPLIVINGIVSGRKGKEPIVYIFISFLPLVNFFTFLYLLSLPDRALVEKIDAIYEKVKNL